MLSIYTLKSAAKAGSYYQEDNYYAKEGEPALGVWFGKGAELLDLEGNATLPDFIAKLEGKLSPTVTMEATTKNHRPGYDLTFSAPKSVSILAIVGKDERVLKAHKIAVNAALKYLEENFAATRVKNNGKTTIEKTNNLLIAKFEHTDSRELDPNLHDHCIIMNATLRSDQKWRTLYFDEVYDNKMLLGVIYRGKLAQELMKAGFEITQTSEQGLFELKGFSEKLIKQFSKRREQITKELEKQNLEGSKAAQIANFNTRERKIAVDPEHLELAWTMELMRCGSSIEWLKNYSKQALERGAVTPPNPYHLAYQAVTKASKELSNWRGVFTTKELIKTAGGLSIRNYSPELINKVIAEQFKSGELLYLTNDLCTTQTARDLEMLNILNMRQGKNKLCPMFSGMAANYLTKKTTEFKEMQPVLKTLLTNADCQLVVSAKNPTNYTFTMKTFVDLSYKYGFYPLGITQTLKRKAEFSKELGLQRVQTIEGFLISCENRAEKIKNQPIPAYRLFQAKQIWILDLHSSISSNQLNRLQSYAKQFGTRILWSNKINKPQAAISALLKHGIKECHLDNKKSIDYVSALMCHPKLNNQIDLINNHIDKTNWQTNTANSLVHWVISKHQQYNAVFSLKKLQLELFSLGITVPKEVLQTELDLALQQSLITVKEGLVTTKANLSLEQSCLKLITSNQKTIDPISTQIDLPNNLTKGQQDAIKLALTTGDRIVGIQGIAGSGKTTMIRSLNKLCKDSGFEIIGLTPTTGAKERLQEGSQNLSSQDLLLRAGIKPMTLRKFLIESEKLLNLDPTLAKLEYGTNKLLILDEASFVSTAEMFAILTKVEQLDARLVVMGDHRQLYSIEAGMIFYLMLGSEMQSVFITENVRFKSAKTLNVMQHIYKNQIPEALKRLGDSLVEIPEHQERLMKMAELYLAKTPEERLNTILITPEHADRKLVNHEIRQGLKQANQLIGLEVNCHNLTQVKLTKAEQQKIYYFKEQDLITFFKPSIELKVKNHEYYLIKHKDLDNQTLTLEHPVTQEQIVWSPEKSPCNINVYRQEARKLMTNDQIRWLKNNEVVGICNGQTATIKSIDQNHDATILLQNGKEILLNLKEFTNQHWDHAYATTTFIAQGADKQMTIALAKGGYSREILSKEIKVGDVLITKESAVNLNQNLSSSKLVKVTEINKDSTAVVQDRIGNDLRINLKKSPTNAYCKDQAIWHSYPNPATRKASNIPKLTSVNEFLVSVTRGDQVTLLVDHIESYQHALEQRVLDVRSSLEFLDPEKNKVRAKVDQMTSNITGIAEKEPAFTSPPKVVTVKNSLYEKSQTVTIEQVINRLHSNILQHATNWLGQPQKTSNLEARWGKKGSLVVKLSGDKAGYWHNFEKGLGGKNLLSLYTEHFNHDFKAAINELSSSLHLGSINKLFTKPINANTNQKSKNITTLDLKKIAYVNKIYNSGTSIFGTLAEKYLREFRGINGCIPSDFRFCAKLKHPDLNRFIPALLAPIKNEQDQIQGIVRIFLNKDGNKLNSNYVDDQGESRKATVKANLGSMINAAVTVNQGKVRNTVYIAEGIETALSIAQAKPNNTIIAALSVSNLKNVPLPNDVQKVVLCADYDGANAISNKTLLTAANFYKERGLEVSIAYPEKIPGMNKVDFNDVLKHLGVNSINKSLQSAELQKSPEVVKAIETTNTPAVTKNLQLNKELSL